MSKDILISDTVYGLLRVDSRKALGRFGVLSNPGFTDHNILTGLCGQLGLDAPKPYDEITEYAGEFFRDSLAEILGIELPASVTEIRAGLHSLQGS